MKKINFAVIGATGLVGSTILEVLRERELKINKLFLAGSDNSVGKKIIFNGKEIIVQSIDSLLEENIDIALFSAGADISIKYASRFAEKNCTVIDNSSAFRMQAGIPLVVPEVNFDIIKTTNKLIANPNCSTIQLIMAIAPLNRHFRIKRMVVSTYQSVSGSGYKALQQLEDEQNGKQTERFYKYPIHENCIPQCDIFDTNGYTAEEWKLINETTKILDNENISLTATAVRVPIIGGHSESVNIEFHDFFDLQEVRKILQKTDGIIVQDDINTELYPMPVNVKNKDEVFVGRIRRDNSIRNGLNLWIVADNLRKGAATNAVQIAEKIINSKDF